MTASAQTVTILFTDLVGSTELLQRAGDEKAQRIFKAHHRLLREAVEAHGGDEVKWLGDGLMVAFDSALDAVKCAIAMQQTSRRPTAGERLEIRAGLNVGEAFIDESDYFGTSVVIARRLCDKGNAGQILASDIVVRLLEGRGADIKSNDLGPLELKGITNPVPAVEIVYDHDPMALLRKLPFVGRAAECETMLKKLAEARTGRGSVILLAGEPGIGKTRLTEEFCDHASSGNTVIRGNCYEGDIAAPFGPWVEALRSLVEQSSDADVRDTLGPGAPDIAALMPEIRRRIPDMEESPRLDPESERARLFESISAFLRNAAEKKPLVIFLDDLHWCDRPSLALLEQIARGCADKRIVIVGTYRDVEVDRVHPLAQTLSALRRMEHHERIAVRGFTEDVVADLLTAIDPSEETAAGRGVLAGVLFRDAEGNPFFIREVLNNLVESGRLVNEDGTWVSAITSVDDLGIPEGIKEVIGRRMSRLSEGCNTMLQRASAMTSGFTWDELRAICDDSEDELLDALDEALGSQLIAEPAKLSYAFTHALIRVTLYDELSTPRRVMLHRRIGEALERLYPNSIDAHLPELAFHFYESAAGGDFEKAVDYARRAGAQAESVFAWEEAAQQYQRALDALDLAPMPDETQKCELLLSLIDVRERNTQLSFDAEVTAKAVVAVDIARRLGSPDLLARAALAYDEWSGGSGARRPELGLLLNEALEMQPDDAGTVRAMLIAALARQAAVRRETEQARALASQALAMARSLADPRALLDVLRKCHVVLSSPAHAPERLAMARERRAIEQATRGAWGGPGSSLLHALLELGDMAATESELTVLEDHAVASRAREAAWVVIVAKATIALAQGRPAEAEPMMLRAVQFGEGLQGGGDPALLFPIQLFSLRLYQGRTHELGPLLETLMGQSDLPLYRCAQAFVYAQTQRNDEARNVLHELAGESFTFVAVPQDNNWLISMFLLTEVCCLIDEIAPAKALYYALHPYAERPVTHNGFVTTAGSTSRLLGQLATLLERWDEAGQHFEYASDHNDRMSFHAWTTWTRLNYGDMLLRRDRPGDRDRAVALLQQALDFAKESGMGKVERDSERLLASIG